MPRTTPSWQNRPLYTIVSTSSDRWGLGRATQQRTLGVGLFVGSLYVQYVSSRVAGAMDGHSSLGSARGRVQHTKELHAHGGEL
jgi:hypothetical protein